jgi:cytochrome c oxidase subunit II
MWSELRVVLRRARPELTVAAPTATTWQSLYDLYWTLAIIAGTITIGALVFFTIKYRSKTGIGASSETERKTSLRPVMIIVILMAITLGSAAFESFQAIAVYNSRLNDPSAIHVSVTAQRFSWSFNCTSGCGVAGVLTVPHNTTIVLDITSIDVFHSFGIPALKVKADAIPGRTNTIWFSAPAGVYRIQCYELCGTGHAFMVAKLIVV